MHRTNTERSHPRARRELQGSWSVNRGADKRLDTVHAGGVDERPLRILYAEPSDVDAELLVSWTSGRNRKRRQPSTRASYGVTNLRTPGEVVLGETIHHGPPPLRAAQRPGRGCTAARRRPP